MTRAHRDNERLNLAEEGLEEGLNADDQQLPLSAPSPGFSTGFRRQCLSLDDQLPFAENCRQRLSRKIEARLLVSLFVRIAARTSHRTGSLINTALLLLRPLNQPTIYPRTRLLLVNLLSADSRI